MVEVQNIHNSIDTDFFLFLGEAVIIYFCGVGDSLL